MSNRRSVRSAPLVSKPARGPVSVVAVLFGLLLVGSLVSLSPVLAQSDPELRPPSRGDVPFSEAFDWPEAHRAFLQDGPGFLLSPAQVAHLFTLDDPNREAWIAEFLADPLPETSENELTKGIELRQRLARAQSTSFQDDRARLLFLRGAPQLQIPIDCAETFRPMEMWTYGETTLLLFQSAPDEPWRLWTPILSKRALYTDEMEYYLEQWEELRRAITARKRIDRFFCRASKRIDKITGVDALFGFEKNRPTDDDFLPLLAAPDDLGEWARRAVFTNPPPEEPLPPVELSVHYPERDGQRMEALFALRMEDPSTLQRIELSETKKEARLVVEGQLEREGRLFDTFRVRYQIPLVDGALGGDPLARPLAILLDRKLRPGEEFLLRLKVTEETTGRVARLARGLRVPLEPVPMPERTLDEAQVIAVGELVERQPMAGVPTVILVPPASDVVFGLWRAEALVTGDAVARVKFLVDGEVQLSRKSPPYSAELRLATQPKEQVVAAEAYDAAGALLARDEVVLNQPRGELRVRILSPRRGFLGSGSVDAEVEVIVPEEKVVESVVFSVNDEEQLRFERPPYRGEITIPASTDLSYLSVVATLEDGTRAEATRFLNAPDYIEEVDVNLIELYTTVIDRRGGYVNDLEQQRFRILEDGVPQTMEKFERVDNLPLSLGIALDTSGSMFESLGTARRAAVGFLEAIVGPQDRAFAVTFASRPALVMERTSDVGAIDSALQGLEADGATSLHDAVATSLHYFSGIRGRRALVLLSDGEDTSSHLGWDETLEYARRSGVSIYTIGLRIGRTQLKVRRKLDALAEQTGGRSIYIDQAGELQGAYAEIERELRSQYLLAYSSNRPATEDDDEFREVAVEVEGSGLSARTLRGYYP